MSLTINQKPSDNSPAYNDLNFVVTESSGAVYSQPNFKFIADIYTNSTRLGRLKTPIYPNSTNKGVFNISRLIENFVSFDWNINDGNVSGCPNAYFPYNVKFGYEYSSGVNSPIVEVSGITNATGLVGYNMALNPIDFVSFNQNDYLMIGTSSKFLTNNRNKRIYIDQKDWLYFWRGDANSVEITYYPSGTGTPFVLTGISDSVIRIPIINIPSGTTYLTVRCKQSGTNKSELYTINIIDECSKYSNSDIYFVNRLGAVESFRFNKVRRDKYNISRRQFQSSPYDLNGSSYSYSQSSKSKSNFYTESKETITLNSNWITEDESKWLKELLMSPYIWIMDNGILKSVNIINSDYEVKKHINDKVFNLNIDIETSFIDKVQRL